MKPEKVIFLDIDGVITNSRTCNGFDHLDMYAINFLIWVCNKTDASIVISSTWRHSHGRPFWFSLFGKHLHDDWKTPWQRGDIRGKEIKTWLYNHKEVKNYLILDDDNDMLEEQFPHFIQTDSIEGMLFKHMDQIKEYWKIDEFPRIKNMFIHVNMFDF